MSTLKLKNVQFSAELTRLFTRLILSNSLNWYASANLRLTEIFVLCWLENLHRKKNHCARYKVASLQVALTTPTKPASEDTISNHIQCFQQAIVLNVLNRFKSFSLRGAGLSAAAAIQYWMRFFEMGCGQVTLLLQNFTKRQTFISRY